MVTRRPRLDSSAPSELAVRPLPSEETTPPVTKTNFVGWELCRRPRENDWSRVPDGRSTGTDRNTVGVLDRPRTRSAVPRRKRIGPRRPGGGGQPDQQRHEDGGRRGGQRDAGVVDRGADDQAQPD